MPVMSQHDTRRPGKSCASGIKLLPILCVRCQLQSPKKVLDCALAGVNMQDIQPMYKWIVDSVIAKARPTFLQDGVDESVLDELKKRWEDKLLESGIYNAAEGEVEDEAAASTAAEDKSDKKRDASAAGLPEGDNAKRHETEGAQAGEAATTANQPSSSAKPSKGVAEKSDEAKVDETGQDSDDEGRGDQIKNMVLAQYDKVQRSKNKWKCTMKHGIVHIDGHEYVFNKATGEFVF
eukprot:TRINITY_DN11046_c0_g3_i1.p1 TRINITY_DN11046_c0_g3~~TRINITY_DN11046_c0_g3_i1.p1  ORF type:complete len:243 (+),score=43.36 TRINITY_DN11046_c0_g3_i1:23-730(+)